MPASDEARRQTLAALRALAADASLPEEIVARPSAALLAALEREGLLSHLNRDLDPASAVREGAAAADGALATAVRDASRRAAQRNLAGLATLVSVHTACARAGIAHLAFKGPASNAALYGDRARRVYGDLDILVLRADRERAAEALRACAFRRPAAGGTMRVFTHRIHFHAVFAPPPQTNLLPVELHWELVDGVNLLRFDLAELFAAADTLSVAGGSVPVLDPAAHLIYLCCHLRKHDPLIRWGLRADRPAEWFCRETRGFPLAWLLDLHHFFLLAAERSSPGRAEQLVGAWNASEEVADCVELLDRVIPSSRRSAAIARLEVSGGVAGARSGRLVGGLLDSPVGRAVVTRSLRLSAAGFFRPIRLLDLPRVLAPSPRRLRAFHRDARTVLPRLYARHVLAMFRRLLGLGGGQP